MSWLRKNWRVTLLVFLLLGSVFALFAPGLGGTTSNGPTNLEYGLQLAGGTRLRATAVGVTAEDIEVTRQNEQAIEQNISDALGIEAENVEARVQANVVEVYANITTTRFATVLSNLGFSPSDVRPGVTEMTRTAIVQTIKTKIGTVGFSGAAVYQIQTLTGTNYIVVEVPGKNASQVKDLIRGRGEVELWAYYPKNGTQVNATILEKEDLEEISLPRTNRRGQPVVPIVLTDAAAEEFASALRKYGFTTPQGIGNCQFQTTGNEPDYCLLTVLDGEVVYSASLGANLAQDIRQGTFARDPSFVITATSMEDARQLYVNLRAGSLPTKLDFKDSYYVAPSFAERYKLLSLVTAIVAAIAVACVVFIRYREAKVAIPMVLTALSEVVILLGFSAATGLALNLSYIAGFIAVIGTGVDDLVIIADEVMTEQVSSSHVFQSRFRKALFTIGGAAATTTIAMSPLIVFSIGDLTGFATITIVGVLMGVIITRPAYGDLLRRLLTDDR